MPACLVERLPGIIRTGDCNNILTNRLPELPRCLKYPCALIIPADHTRGKNFSLTNHLYYWRLNDKHNATAVKVEGQWRFLFKQLCIATRLLLCPCDVVKGFEKAEMSWQYCVPELDWTCWYIVKVTVPWQHRMGTEAVWSLYISVTNL